MKKKSLGQVAYEAYWPAKYAISNIEKSTWNLVATAVAREVRKRDKEKDLKDWDKINIEEWK